MVVNDSRVYFDPYDVDINADPYPIYARMREEAPIYHNERYGFWALSRHEDVQKALADWQAFSSARSDILDVIKAGVELPQGVIMFEDPPVHTMHRRLLSRVFTPKRMALLEDQVRDFCIRCLDPLVGSAGFDVITELGAMLPMRVIGMLLGIPDRERADGARQPTVTHTDGVGAARDRQLAGPAVRHRPDDGPGCHKSF